MIYENLISIIIPIYKAEQYIEKCINSVLAQTYKNLEIILVDDGSPDNCGVICDEYAKIDNRIIVIHKENGGQASARNEGINVAKGEFIGFVDSDDYIAPDMYDTLLNNLKHFNADISFINYTRVSNDLGIVNQRRRKAVILDSFEAILLCYKSHDLTSLGVKLYRREIFEDIRMPVGQTDEDHYIFVQTITKAKIIVFENSRKYFYRKNPNSTTAIISLKKINDSILAMENNIRQLPSELSELNVLFCKRIAVLKLKKLELLNISQAKYISELKKIKKELFPISKWKFTFSKKRLLVFYTLTVSPYLYITMLRICRKLVPIKT